MKLLEEAEGELNKSMSLDVNKGHRFLCTVPQRCRPTVWRYWLFGKPHFSFVFFFFFFLANHALLQIVNFICVRSCVGGSMVCAWVRAVVCACVMCPNSPLVQGKGLHHRKRLLNKHQPLCIYLKTNIDLHGNKELGRTRNLKGDCIEPSAPSVVVRPRPCRSLCPARLRRRAARRSARRRSPESRACTDREECRCHPPGHTAQRSEADRRWSFVCWGCPLSNCTCPRCLAAHQGWRRPHSRTWPWNDLLRKRLWTQITPTVAEMGPRSSFGQAPQQPRSESESSRSRSPSRRLSLAWPGRWSCSCPPHFDHVPRCPAAVAWPRARPRTKAYVPEPAMHSFWLLFIVVFSSVDTWARWASLTENTKSCR